MDGSIPEVWSCGFSAAIDSGVRLLKEFGLAEASTMIAENNYPYRVFLSYAENDLQHALRLVERLQQLNLYPFWDKLNLGGLSFLESIKERIDHSHVCIALLTSESVSRTWVNHEIAYAVGHNIRVLPLSLGPVPEGMISGIHAVRANDIDDLLLRLTRDDVIPLVKAAETAGVYECAEVPEVRTDALIKHCKQVGRLRRQHEQPLRHLAAFGSFSLPSNPADHIWVERSDDWPSSPHRTELLSEEKRQLEAYAERFGCDLVLYPSLEKLTPRANRARVKVLQSFLRNMRNTRAPVRVAFDERGRDENLIILGDWFSAESLTPRFREGYWHTTITSHAPTVLKRIETFDLQFSGCSFMSPDSAISWLDEHFMPDDDPPNKWEPLK